MREYIFTERERELAQAFVERGKQGENFRMLLSRMRKSAPQLKQDYEILIAVLKKTK